MADYKSNYGATEDCKLCGKHQDSQEEIFDCEVVTKISNISLKYEELFTLEIKVETASKLEEIHKLRENKTK